MWVVGARKLNSIKMVDCAKWINMLKVKPRGKHPDGTLHPVTIRRAATVAAAVFTFAVRQDYIAKSPIDGIELPTEKTLDLEPFEGRALSHAEVLRVANAAARVHPMYGLLVRFLAVTGLRAAEMAALRVRDVIQDGIVVRRTAKHTAQGIRYGTPKSKASRRTVPILDVLDGSVARDLAAHIADLPTSPPDAPLFPSRAPGSKGERTTFVYDRPIDPGTFRRRIFEPACEAAGVGKVRLHDLRHTAGSLWLQAGVSLFNASKYLGHGDTSLISKRYGHLTEESIRDDIARVASYRTGVSAGNVIPLRAAQ